MHRTWSNVTSVIFVMSTASANLRQRICFWWVYMTTYHRFFKATKIYPNFFKIWNTSIIILQIKSFNTKKFNIYTHYIFKIKQKKRKSLFSSQWTTCHQQQNKFPILMVFATDMSEQREKMHREVVKVKHHRSIKKRGWNQRAWVSCQNLYLPYVK